MLLPFIPAHNLAFTFLLATTHGTSGTVLISSLTAAFSTMSHSGRRVSAVAVVSFAVLAAVAAFALVR